MINTVVTNYHYKSLIWVLHMASKVLYKNLSYLPLLEYTESLFPRNHLQNIYVISCQHILPSTHMMFRSMIRMGLDPQKLGVIGKCYSTNDNTMANMKDEGIYVCPSSNQFNSSMSFDMQFQNSIKHFLKNQIKRMAPNVNDIIVILDDGGELLTAAQHLIEYFPNICGVEQNSSGYHKLAYTNMKFPIKNVAFSKEKLHFEAPLIAQAVFKKLKDRNLTDVPKKEVLIVGNGCVGQAVKKILLEKTDHNIKSFDLVQEKTDIDYLDFGSFDIIIGATGNTIMTHNYYDSLKDGVVLLSVSSSDREFDAVHLRQLSNKTWQKHDDVQYKNIQLLNCGFPLNFSGEEGASIPLHQIQLVCSFLLLGVCEFANLASGQKHFVQLDKDLCNKISTEFNSKSLKQSVALKKDLSIKNEFLNNISHEVRTPLSGVVNISETLVENWLKYSDKERFDNLKLVAQSGKRLLMLMNNILDLSKLESGKVNFSMKTSNLALILEEMIRECNLLYLGKNSNIKIQSYIQPNINSNAIMDEKRITQVLCNLLENAIKFMDFGTVKIYLQKQGLNLEVIVRDEGVAIPENELESIFEPFVQSTRTKNEAGGTGIGLAICREIITAHHGRIWAVNNQARGTSFHFLIPSKSVQLKSNSSSKQNTVLIIDDDQICHNILGLILKAENYKVISAYGGIEGLKILKENKESIDLVLLDLMMPDIAGLNVLKNIKSDPSLSNIPIIIQSASHDQTEYQRAIDLGASSCITKPYDRIMLIAQLKKHINGYNATEDTK